MSGRGSAGNGAGKQPGKAAGRLPQAAAIRRQQRIVRLRDVERLTYAEIAAEIGMGEKEVRLAYRRYVDEVAPLLAAPAADEQIAEALRRLDDLVQRLWRLLESGKNETACVGAARTIADLTFREIELRQHLGLLPRLSQVTEYPWMAEQIRRIFDKYDLPAEALEEIQQHFGDGAKEEP